MAFTRFEIIQWLLEPYSTQLLVPATFIFSSYWFLPPLSSLRA